MSKKEQVAVVDARASDLARVNELAREAGMTPVRSIENVRVAWAANRQMVGYIRLTYGGMGDVAHVNPIVVDRAHRYKGIGRQMMDCIHAVEPELRLVARGDALPFYQSLGYRKIPWFMLSEEVSAECAHCPDRATCQPQPMGFVVRD